MTTQNSLIIAPPTARFAAPTREQTEILQSVRQALTEAKITGYGADGMMVGVEERVLISRLWCDERFKDALSFTPAQIHEAQVRLSGALRDAASPVIHCGKIKLQGDPTCDLLILDATGILLYQASAEIDLREVTVRIYPMDRTYSEMINASLARHIFQPHLSMIVIGRMVSYLLTLQDEEARIAKENDQPYTKLTQANLAAQHGFDDSYLSVCRRLAEQPTEIVEWIEQGVLPWTTVRDSLLTIKDPQQRLVYARKLAIERLGGHAGPAIKLIDRAATPTRKGYDWTQQHFVARRADLWTPPATEEIEVAVIVAHYLNDLNRIIESYPTGATPSAVKALRKAIAHPDFQDLIEQVIGD